MVLTGFFGGGTSVYFSLKFFLCRLTFSRLFLRKNNVSYKQIAVKYKVASNKYRQYSFMPKQSMALNYLLA